MRQEQKKLEGVTRREALKIGAGVLASVLSSKYLLLEARADSRKNANGESGEKLETVSIEDMKKWDRETKGYRHAPDTRSDRSFTTSVRFKFEDAIILVVGIVGYEDTKKTGMALTYKKDGQDKEYSTEIPISSLSKMFYDKMGVGITSLKIVIEKGVDTVKVEDKLQRVEYAQVWVIPNGDIKDGNPVLPAFTFYQVKSSNNPKIATVPKVLKTEKPMMLASK